MSSTQNDLQERMKRIATGGLPQPIRCAASFDEAYLIRCLAYLLRHAAHDRGVAIDARGWGSVIEIVAALRELHWSLAGVSAEQIIDFVRGKAADRFEVCDGWVRARYGHSVPSVMVADPARPPEHLFHGTTRAAEVSVRKCGLKPMGRSQVHLTSDLAYAERVARGAEPDWIILRVRAGEAAEAGVVFRQASDHVWLADHVAPAFVEIVRDGGESP